VHVDEWCPPADPNPQSILQEACVDTRTGHFETALAKHIWFHENALSIEPALYGVRLSFALSYWLQLAEQPPPALTKLKEIRERALNDVLAGHNVRESFHDMEAIDEWLNDQTATANVFEMLEEKSPKTAREVFELAMPSLVHCRMFTLINKYISPTNDFARMKEEYRHRKIWADLGAEHRNFTNMQFMNNSTTLVAILVQNDRRNEAEEIAAAAIAELDDTSFRMALDHAMMGIIPDPWPPKREKGTF
jgi:hypothetical protein